MAIASFVSSDGRNYLIKSDRHLYDSKLRKDNTRRFIMGIILLGIGYIALLAFFVKCFQRVHRWDEEICSMKMRGSARTEQAPTTKAA
jgi:Cys-tRNA synthase (O-phospho-L-seryl-tRNA:Cys-tRNA synthase)